MHNDDPLYANIRAAFDDTPVPAVDVDGILRRAGRPRRNATGGALAAGFGVAAALVLAIMTLAHPASLLAAVRSDVRMALRAIGLPSGPPIPNTMLKRLKADSHSTDVAEAAKDVPFALVAPAGLPSDARQTRLAVSSTGNWSSKTHAWSIGPKIASWTYVRRNGSSFTLLASRYDPNARLYSYLWQTVEDARGNPVMKDGHAKLIRHRAYFWRNGDQVMSASTGSGISAAEIAAIRTAMGGIALPTVATNGPRDLHRVIVIKH